MERADGLQHMRIPAGQTYVSPGEAYVEGDASSASYFLAGATITGGTITVEVQFPYWDCSGVAISDLHHVAGELLLLSYPPAFRQCKRKGTLSQCAR